MKEWVKIYVIQMFLMKLWRKQDKTWEKKIKNKKSELFYALKLI